MRYFVLIFLLCTTLLSHAAIFIQQDKNGNVIYSDTPLNTKAKRIKLPSTNSLPAQTTGTTGAAAPTTPSTTRPILPQVIETTLPQSNQRQEYRTFIIVSPKDQETLQNMQVIPVEVKVEPALQEGDKVLLFLDGNPWGSPLPATQLQMEHVDRGQHQIFAAIIDKEQRIVKQSNSITIFVLRPTLNSPARVVPPPQKTALFNKIVNLFK